MDRFRRAETSDAALSVTRQLRERMPGDSKLGDPLSTAGEKPRDMIARTVAEGVDGRRKPSAVREVGLLALQMWQAASESQGRGHGDRDVAILFTDLVGF